MCASHCCASSLSRSRSHAALVAFAPAHPPARKQTALAPHNNNRRPHAQPMDGWVRKRVKNGSKQGKTTQERRSHLGVDVRREVVADEEVVPAAKALVALVFEYSIGCSNGWG